MQNEGFFEHLNALLKKLVISTILRSFPQLSHKIKRTCAETPILYIEFSKVIHKLSTICV